MPFEVQGDAPFDREDCRAVATSRKARSARMPTWQESASASSRRRYFGRPIVANADLLMIKELRRLGGLLKHVHNESDGSYSHSTAQALHAVRDCIDPLAAHPREPSAEVTDVIGKEVPIDPEKAAGRGKAQQIRDLTDYQRAADEAAKVMYFTTRGFQSETFAGQQLEMIALSMESVRSVQPVKHFIFSFKEGEVPSPEQIEELLDIVEERYGSTGHQMMAAVSTRTPTTSTSMFAAQHGEPEHQVVKVNDGRSWGTPAPGRSL